MEPWENVVEIPEGKVGEYEISHFTRPAGEVVRSSLRTAFCGAQADKPLVFDRETRWHRLSYEGGTWMTDLPIEQQQHDHELKGMCGTVLVGGLGVGYAANVLAARPEVDEVVVVEISPEVISLVGKHVRDPDGKVTIVEADLFKYLERQNLFDFGFFDIWQSDGEGTFHNTVVPLRELAAGSIDRVVCWNENVMRGQLNMALGSRWMALQVQNQVAPEGASQEVVEQLARFKEAWAGSGDLEKLCTEIEGPGSVYHNWAVPFWIGVKEGVVTEENFRKVSGAYAGTYGHEGWRCWWNEIFMKTGEV